MSNITVEDLLLLIKKNEGQSNPFVPWMGGNTPPFDWDGGDVLWAFGCISESGDWNHSPQYVVGKAYIIGYRRAESLTEIFLNHHPEYRVMSHEAIRDAISFGKNNADWNGMI